MGKMTVPPQSARASGAAQMKRRLPAASSFTEVKVRSPMQKRQARTKENTPVVISVQCYGGRGDRWNEGRWCGPRFRPQPPQNLSESMVHVSDGISARKPCPYCSGSTIFDPPEPGAAPRQG